LRRQRASAWVERAALVFAAVAAAVAIGATPASAGTVPTNFQDSTVFTGLTEPTAIRFASDGRIFVAEKRGVIKVFDNLQDTTATVFADLNVNVYNGWDRGLLGLALAPNFPTDPSVYVMYSYDGDIGGTAPRWGTPGVYSDPCPMQIRNIYAGFFVTFVDSGLQPSRGGSAAKTSAECPMA
jgi:glucose/arabinose dehydrogenase